MEYILLALAIYVLFVTKDKERVSDIISGYTFLFAPVLLALVCFYEHYCG